jgi:predicted AlkP superfamily phosphohydrolase/phosphomutase
MIVGLDCAPPGLVFERFAEVMPTVRGLMGRGTWGPLRSTVPPITVPAWTSMVTGRDPGELGLYGFRNRTPGGYGLRTSDATDVRCKRVWDFIGDHGRRVSVLFVPPSFPPPPVRGHSVSCFLWPGPERPWTFPAALGPELERRFGAYRADVPDFRADDPERVLREIHAMTDQHFAMASHLWDRDRPDFMMMVEMGPDRLHHALWHRMDPEHPRGTYDPAWEGKARDYYAGLDAHIARLLERTDERTTVILASDHGARSMVGGVRVNEWLRRAGWLALRGDPEAPGPLRPEDVDFGRTRAWGEGGYYARIFLNVRGREPQGTIDPADYGAVRQELAAALEAMPGPDGAPLGTRVVWPEREYRAVRGQPPDLMAFFGDLAWRSIGTVGPGPLWVEGDGRGPDGCNHDWNGVFVMAGGGAPARGHTEGLHILDVARTVLGLMEIPAPQGMAGRDWSTAP